MQYMLDWLHSIENYIHEEKSLMKKRKELVTILNSSYTKYDYQGSYFLNKDVAVINSMFTMPKKRSVFGREMMVADESVDKMVSTLRNIFDFILEAMISYLCNDQLYL